MPLQKSLIIASTPRSGSNLLNSYIRNLNVFGTTTEFLNFEHAANIYGDELSFSEQDYRTNPREVLEKIISKFQTADGIFSTKIHYEHFAKMMHKGFNPFEVLINPRFVYIYRKDVVAQAVSYSKAMQQGAWTSLEKVGEDISYDFSQILTSLQMIIDSNKGWQKLFTENKISPYVVEYEKLSEDPKHIVSEVMSFYGHDLSEKEISSIQTKLRPQRDNINKEWKKRFEEDFRKAQKSSG